MRQRYRPILEAQTRSFAQTADVAYMPKPLPKQRPKPASVQRTQQLPDTEDLPPPKKGNWLLPLGVGMCGGLLLLMFTITILLPAWNNLNNQWHYGDNHVSHFDVRGHHFVGEVYRGFVTVYDIPNGHPENSHVFMLQSASENAVVVYQVQDVNHDGIPDITIGTDGSPIGITLYGTKDNSFVKNPPETDK